MASPSRMLASAPPMSPRLAAVAAAALLATACSVSEPEPVVPPRAAAPATRHVLALVELGGQTPRVVSKRFVEQPLQLDRAPGPDGWTVVVDGEDGATLYSAPLRQAGVTRGEFPGPTGEMELHLVPQERTVVALRLPDVPGAARLRLIGTEPADPVTRKPLGPRPELASFGWAEVRP